jgi:hypothetical protein
MSYDHRATVDDMVAAFRTFVLLASVVSERDGQQAAETVAKAQAIGFMIDPTAYRDALFSGSLDRQEQLIRLFNRTRAELAKLFPDTRALTVGAEVDG